MRSDEDLPDLGDLERFAESLLQEAIASEENTTPTTEMVGTPPEIMESSGCGGAISMRENQEQVKQVFPAEITSRNISRTSRKRPLSRQPRQNHKKFISEVKPQDTFGSPQQDFCFVTGSPTCVSVPNESAKTDIIATAFNDAISPSDCITIIVPTAQDDSGDCVFLGEAVQEVTTSSYLMPPLKDEPLSPRSDITETVKSDCGYESYGSPHSDISSSDAMSDLWNESFSQLFPILS